MSEDYEIVHEWSVEHYHKDYRACVSKDGGWIESRRHGDSTFWQWMKNLLPSLEPLILLIKSQKDENAALRAEVERLRDGVQKAIDTQQARICEAIPRVKRTQYKLLYAEAYIDIKDELEALLESEGGE